VGAKPSTVTLVAAILAAGAMVAGRI